jgi:hypothetical protein
MSGKGGSRPTHGQRSGALYLGKRPQGYAAWVNMRQRCTNRNSRDFKNYGGRGISYCRRWEVFQTFIEDMGEPASNMTLDRIDNMADYSPDNCRWVTRAVQNLNKRNVVRYEMNGQYLTLGQWARVTGIQRLTLRHRLKAGWPIERALTEKPKWTAR